MKKKLKDLTRAEMIHICESANWHCKKCPLYNKRNKVCARGYFDTLTSKFDCEEINKEVEVPNEEDFE